MPPLRNQRQECFAQLIFAAQGTQTPDYECAIRAGYSLKAARPVASRLLTYANIQARLAELNEAAAKGRIATVQERKERLSEIIRARAVDFTTDEGKITLTSKSKNAGAVESVKRKTQRIGEAIVSDEIELKLLNPIQAIQELNRMEKLYEEKTVVNVVQITEVVMVRPQE